MSDRTPWQERIGVGERCNAIPSEAARQPTRRRKVIAEEGPRKGQVGGFQTDHANGRRDATVIAPPMTMNPNIVAMKKEPPK